MYSASPGPALYSLIPDHGVTNFYPAPLPGATPTEGGSPNIYTYCLIVPVPGGKSHFINGTDQNLTSSIR